MEKARFFVVYELQLVLKTLCVVRWAKYQQMVSGNY